MSQTIFFHIQSFIQLYLGGKSRNRLNFEINKKQFSSVQITVFIIIKQKKTALRMSDLSLLIQNQKQVIVDQSYLEKYKVQQPQKQRVMVANNGMTRVLSSRQIKINTNFMPNKRNPNSPRSYFNNISSVKSESSDSNQQLYKIDMRVRALDEHQKRLQNRFTKEFAQLHETIFKKKGQYNQLINQLTNIKSEINESKKVIGQVLNDITKPK